MVRSPIVRSRLALLVVALLVVIAFTVSFSAGQSHAVSPFPGDGVRACQEITVNAIALGDGQLANNHIYGNFCSPRTGPSRVVLLLVHGATYSHLYWDFPYKPELYSAVRAFTVAGYSTFTIDRIGIGMSSHPASGLLTLASNAFVVHEIVGRLKAGSIGGVTFGKVILAGHSFGTATVLTEAATYRDVDGVIWTGALHKVSLKAVAIQGAAFIPANTDPSGRFAGLDSGYLTTKPGTRGSLFVTTQVRRGLVKGRQTR